MCKKAPFGKKFVDECVSKRRLFQNSEQIGGIMFLYCFLFLQYQSVDWFARFPLQSQGFEGNKHLQQPVGCYTETSKHFRSSFVLVVSSGWHFKSITGRESHVLLFLMKWNQTKMRTITRVLRKIFLFSFFFFLVLKLCLQFYTLWNHWRLS